VVCFTLFDIEDAHFLKTDLWMIGNVALTLLHFFYEINEGRNVIKFVDSFWPLIQTHWARRMKPCEGR